MIIHIKKCLEEFRMESISCRELFTFIMIKVCYLVFDMSDHSFARD